ncbi:MAG: hypothetical protein C5B60_07330 [Chloroflexi bacterium]|nr:MAG: hypothetical protein C5B60_07330 [Chloroflexota bacterium]
MANKYSYTAVGSGLLVAWRPDGRLLAVDATAPVDAVTLYDCATGKVVTTFKPDTNKGVASLEQEANALIWSPDGLHLALYDTSGGVISLWSGSSLPHA